MTKKRRVPLVIIFVLGLVVLVLAWLTVKNRFGAEFDQLDEADQAVLSEYNALCTSLGADDVWDGFDLQDKTVLAMAGDWGESYLIIPSSRWIASLPQRWLSRTIGIFRSIVYR